MTRLINRKTILEMLIEQVKPVVKIYYRKERNDIWQISRIEGLDQAIKLQSLDIEISMAELYFDVSDLGNVS